MNGSVRNYTDDNSSYTSEYSINESCDQPFGGCRKNNNNNYPSKNVDDGDSTSFNSLQELTGDLSFKKRKSIYQRKEESRNIRLRFPAKVPVIVERYAKEKSLPCLDKTKYLVPQNLLLSQFMSIIRSRMCLGSTETIYLLVNKKTMVAMMSTIGQIYRTEADEDGFLYMTYASQEAFGASSSTSVSTHLPNISFIKCSQIDNFHTTLQDNLKF